MPNRELKTKSKTEYVLPFFDIGWEEIGQRFNTLRKRLNLSLRDLSQITNISVAHLQRIESGKTDMSLSRFVAICTALGAIPGDILEEFYEFNFESRSMPKADIPVLWKEPVRFTFLNRLWKFAILLLWSPLAEERVKVVKFPLPSLKEAFQKYASTVLSLSTEDRRALHIALSENPFSKLQVLGLLPNVKELDATESFELWHYHDYWMSRSILTFLEKNNS